MNTRSESPIAAFQRLESGGKARQGLALMGYLLPLLAFSLVILLLNHEALVTNINPIKEAAPRLKRIAGSPHQSQFQPRDKAMLDFIVAGFPKCGTTTLLYAFLRHNETRIAPKEFCGMNGNGKAENRITSLNQVIQGFSVNNTSELPVKRGIKCPMAISDTTGIQLISANFRYTKIIVGVRHPVKFFQSFYNVSTDGYESRFEAASFSSFVTSL